MFQAGGLTEGLVLRTWNANNQRMTWGVLGAAVTALYDYRDSQGDCGIGKFVSFDGAIEVRMGSIG